MQIDSRLKMWIGPPVTVNTVVPVTSSAAPVTTARSA
jgi:hypothetical protein